MVNWLCLSGSLWEITLCFLKALDWLKKRTETTKKNIHENNWYTRKFLLPLNQMNRINITHINNTTRKYVLVSHWSYGLMLPLRNKTMKRMVVFHPLWCSVKDLQSIFQKNIWSYLMWPIGVFPITVWEIRKQMVKNTFCPINM